MRPATYLTNSYALAGQLRKTFNPRPAPIENKKWFVGDASQRNKVVGIYPFIHSTLYKSYIHLYRRIGQPLNVINGTFRRKYLESYTVLLEYLGIFLGISLERAALWTTRHNNCIRRCKIEKQKYANHNNYEYQYGRD